MRIVLILFFLISCATTPDSVIKDINSYFNPQIKEKEEQLYKISGEFSVEAAKIKYPEMLRSYESCVQSKKKDNCESLFDALFYKYWTDKITLVKNEQVDKFCNDAPNMLEKCESLYYRALIFIELEKSVIFKDLEKLKKDRDDLIELAIMEAELENQHRRQRIAGALTVLGNGISHQADSGAQLNYNQSKQTCFNDYSCGIAEACIKNSYSDIYGTCMQKLNNYGTPDYQYQKQGVPGILSDCISSLDCPLLWSCEAISSSPFKKTCMKTKGN